MTKKDATNILYNIIQDANFVEDIITEDIQFLIFKSNDNDDFMVCKFFESEDIGEVSDLFHTINECYEWVNQNP